MDISLINRLITLALSMVLLLHVYFRTGLLTCFGCSGELVGDFLYFGCGMSLLNIFFNKGCGESASENGK